MNSLNIANDGHQCVEPSSTVAMNYNNSNHSTVPNKSSVGKPDFDLFGYSEDIAPSVVNLSNHTPTQPQISLLEKGLNF